MEVSSDSDNEGTEGYEKGGYHPEIGEHFEGGRYVVVRKLGWGPFSTVWLAEEVETGRTFALKVQTSASHDTEADQDEVTLLNQIRVGDPDNQKCCARLHDSFMHSGPNGEHMCMLFEVLEDDLLDLIKIYKYRGVPIPVVKRLTKQILIGLAFLHAGLNIIHTDLKPENVRLTVPLRPAAEVLPSSQVSGRPGDAHTPLALQNGNGSLTKIQEKMTNRNQKEVSVAKARLSEELSEASGDEALDFDVSSQSQPSRDVPGFGGEHQGHALHGRGRIEREGSFADEPSFTRESGRLAEDELDVRLATAKCKIVDFRNACWTYQQHTTDIQTCQYRSPEVLLGASYSTSADMWSLACMVFELVTGNFLFDPRPGKDYERDEDHLARMMELLGKMPLEVAFDGKYAKDFFKSVGKLRNIKKLKFWPLDRVLVEKYDVPRQEAEALAAFLVPMLEFVPERRATAVDMLSHPWLQSAAGSASPILEHANGEYHLKDRKRKRSSSPGGHGVAKRSSPSVDECLPRDVLEAIMEKLDLETLCTARLVSRSFCAAASANISGLTLRSPSRTVFLERFPCLGHVRVLNSYKDYGPAQLDPRLRAVITHLTVSPAAWVDLRDSSWLPELPKLRELEMDGLSLARHGDAVVRRFPNLEVLRIGNCTDSLAMLITTATWLTGLHIGLVSRDGVGWGGASTDFSWIRHATQLSKLQALSIAVCHEALPLIGNLTGLTGLTWLGGADAIEDSDSIAPLSCLSRLRSLQICPGIADRNLAIACSLGGGSLAKLQVQVTEGASYDCGRLLARQTALTYLAVGGEQLCNLRHMGALRMELLQSLELLQLGDVDGEGLAVLQKASNLTSLHLSTFFQQPDLGLGRTVGRLTQLRSLQLDMKGDDVLDLPLALGPLTALTELRVVMDMILDLPALLGLTSLRVLDLDGCCLTDEVVPELAVLTNLKKLRLISSWVTTLAPALSVLNPLCYIRGLPPVDARLGEDSTNRYL